MTLKLFFFAVLALSASVEIPSSLKKCNRKDANFKQCLFEAIHGALTRSPVKEIGYPLIDPLDIPSLVIGAGTRAVNFQQNYKNIKITGLSKVKCSSIDFDADAKTFTFDCGVSEVLFEFEYDFNGKILLFPIYGKGPGSIDIIEPTVHLVLNLEEFDKKGKKHFKVGSYDLHMVPKSIKFKFENLFNGDKALGDNINQVLNDNWAEVYADVQKGYEGAIGDVGTGIANAIFRKVSVEELFGDA